MKLSKIKKKLNYNYQDYDGTDLGSPFYMGFGAGVHKYAEIPVEHSRCLICSINAEGLNSFDVPEMYQEYDRENSI